ncbi:hypothetical protein ACNKF0_00120 [Nocardioides sp. T5]|uniref:hypothetical protein n=1 Tax=Nocardioides sp. T5 TaxID=3400182 RepID=UPI003A84A49A
MADELKRLYRPGQDFSLTHFYANAEDRLQAMYPANTTVQATIRQILQRHRDEGLVRFNGNGQYTYLGRDVQPPARRVTPLAQAAYDLAARITAETKIAASDYLAVARADDPERALAELLSGRHASPTFYALHRRGRLDLSFERLAIDDSARFKLHSSLVSAAAHRLDYYESDGDV